MSLAAIAKASGDVSCLFPKGCSSVEEIPFDLARVISHAYRVLGWRENLTNDEMPPEWMWPHEDELELWFKQVERDRKERYGGSSKDDDDDDFTMMGNSLAEEKRNRVR